MASGLCTRCGSRKRAGKIEYCKSCLCRIVEQRAQKALASGNPSGNTAVIARNGGNSLACAVASHLLKKVSPPGLQHKRSSKSITMIAPKCADDVAANFLESLIGAKPGIRKKAIGLFEFVTEKELSLYARTKRIKYRKAKSIGLKQSIQAFQEKYPGTIHALARSSAKLRRVQNSERN